MSLNTRKRPSAAMIVAAVALCFALVGTAVAGTDSVSRALTKSKVKKIAKKQADKALKANVSGSHVNLADQATNANNANNANNATNATNATNAQNATNLGGQPASAYASSNAVRWATVNSDGTIVASESKGITQANITTPGTGQYCLNGLSPAPTGSSISARFGASLGSQYFAETTPTGGSFCTGLQIGIATYNSANASSNQPFTITVY